MEIRQRHVGPVVCLDVAGRLVYTDQDGLLCDTVITLLSQGSRQILLNLKDVSQMDTSGLAALTTIKLASQRTGADIRLLSLPVRIHNMLVVTRLITLFDVFESEVEALRSFSLTAARQATAN